MKKSGAWRCPGGVEVEGLLGRRGQLQISPRASSGLGVVQRRARAIDRLRKPRPGPHCRSMVLDYWGSKHYLDPADAKQLDASRMTLVSMLSVLRAMVMGAALCVTLIVSGCNDSGGAPQVTYEPAPSPGGDDLPPITRQPGGGGGGSGGPGKVGVGPVGPDKIGVGPVGPDQPYAPPEPSTPTTPRPGTPTTSRPSPTSEPVEPSPESSP